MSSYNLDGCDYVFSFHFEMRVASPVRRVVYLYLTGLDNLPVNLGYEGTNND